MHSYNHFRPGGRSNTSRIIQVANQNAIDGKINTCYCIPDKYDKNTPGTFDSSVNTSNYVRISEILRSTKGGKIQFVGGPSTLNYLGKREGMPGGSGAPPLNRFR